MADLPSRFYTRYLSFMVSGKSVKFLVMDDDQARLRLRLNNPITPCQFKLVSSLIEGAPSMAAPPAFCPHVAALRYALPIRRSSALRTASSAAFLSSAHFVSSRPFGWPIMNFLPTRRNCRARRSAPHAALPPRVRSTSLPLAFAPPHTLFLPAFPPTPAAPSDPVSHSASAATAPEQPAPTAACTPEDAA